jgi:hypothetical protein
MFCHESGTFPEVCENNCGECRVGLHHDEKSMMVCLDVVSSFTPSRECVGDVDRNIS